MNTPSRRALGDVRNQVLGTPARDFVKPISANKESLKTPAGEEFIQRPVVSTSQPNFLSFDGDDFEVYSEEQSKPVGAETKEVAEEEDSDYEPIESFDVLPESPDRFEDLMEHYRELEKVILVEDCVYSGESNEWYCNSDIDEDLDLDSITILEEPEL